MNRIGRRTAVALCVAGLMVGCTPQPAGSSGGGSGGASVPYPPAPPGPYPPLPRARQLKIRWSEPRKDWRTVFIDKSEPGVYGRGSLELDGDRVAYARDVYAKGSGYQPKQLVIRESDGRLRTVRQGRPGRVIAEVRMCYPWVVWIDLNEANEADWIIRACNPDSGADWVIARPDKRVGNKQLTPATSMFGTLLAWDQRICTRRGPRNVVRAYDVATRRRWTAGGPGPVHDPAVGGKTVYWNEGFTRPEGQQQRAFDDIFASQPGSPRRRVTFTTFGRWCSASPNTLTWLDTRRYWLGQQSMTDVYFRRRNGPTTRVTSHGYADPSLAGDDLVAWVEFPGYICALDLRTNRGYRLTGVGRTQATLLDVNGRRLAYELSPDIWNPKSGDRTQLRVMELRRRGRIVGGRAGAGGQGAIRTE